MTRSLKPPAIVLDKISATTLAKHGKRKATNASRPRFRIVIETNSEVSMLELLATLGRSIESGGRQPKPYLADGLPEPDLD